MLVLKLVTARWSGFIVILHLSGSGQLARVRGLGVGGADGRQQGVPAQRQQRGRQLVAGRGSVSQGDRTRAVSTDGHSLCCSLRAAWEL